MSTLPTPPSEPSQADIDAAVATLLRSWAPADTVIVGGTDDQDDDYDPYDGCGCGGEDEDGTPVCNCGGGCSCVSCEAFAWQRSKICAAETGTVRCTLPALYRVEFFRLLPTTVRDIAPEAVCPHDKSEACPCSPGDVYADGGERPQTHQYLSACSVPHAQLLVDRMRQLHTEPADKPARLRWRIEAWTYQPHFTELPEPLAQLRDFVALAVSHLDGAVRAWADPRRDVAVWLKEARGDLARAAHCAAQPLPDPGDEDDSYDDELTGPPQEEPSDPW
ncbi:hypothetical protein [Streptomyces niveus]|uniref:hypothetical protein n=1 Tax=Streptomyces niveus TaxID=193462 RepID=UPI0036902140